MTLMLIKNQAQKKNHIAQNSHLNTSLGIMMMMPLDHNLKSFLK